MPTWPADPVALPDCQLNWEALKKLFTVVEARSSAKEGPGAIGANVVYTAVEVTLTPGSWLVYGQAAMSSQTAADEKVLVLWNQTASAFFANSASPAIAAPAVNVDQGFTTFYFVKVSADTKVRLAGIQNGGSQITIGVAAGIVFTNTQKITALKVQ